MKEKTLWNQGNKMKQQCKNEDRSYQQNRILDQELQLPFPEYKETACDYSNQSQREVMHFLQSKSQMKWKIDCQVLKRKFMN